MTRKIVVTTYACPACGQRVEMRVPVTTAICHDRHRATVMRPVDDATARP